MTSMRAAVLAEWGGDLSVETVDRPEPAPGEALVEVKACGVTRTVENVVQGGFADDETFLPRIPGHEFTGVVREVGADVRGLEPGDRVMAYFYLVCGDCDACRRGDTNQCTDFGGFLGVQCDGAYAEYVSVPEANLLPLPESTSFIEGAMAADGLATPLHVCERTDVGDDDTVLVIGAAGRVGVHLSKLAANRGAHVLAADIDAERLAFVDSVTPDSVTPVDATSADFTDRVRDATPHGDGPTVVVDTVGDIDTIERAWDAMAMGGTLVSLTTHHDEAFAPLLKEFVQKEASLIGSRYATKDEMVRAARLLGDGRIEVEYTQVVDLEAVPAVHEAFMTGETHGMTILEP